jgi:hypothetical protein
VTDWREYLINTLGIAAAAEETWRAVPVHTEARLDHVRLADRGLVQLDEVGSSALRDSFNATFGPTYRLEMPGPRDFVLHGGDWARADVQTRDPATFLGRDVRAALPTGAQARALRTLSAEVEMWLHSHPWNVARQRAGQPTVTALWMHRTVAPQRVADVRANGSLIIAGEDSFSRELVAASAARASADASWRALDATAARRHVVVVTWPITDGGLARIDSDWIEPAVAAVHARRLDRIDIVVNSVAFSLQALHRWRWWRPRRHWLEALQLARAAAARS